MIKTQTYPESSENLNPSKYIYCFGGEVEWGAGQGWVGDTTEIYDLKVRVFGL